MEYRKQDAVAHVGGRHLVFRVQHYTIHHDSASRVTAPEDETITYPNVEVVQKIGQRGIDPLEIQKDADVQAHEDVIIKIHIKDGWSVAGKGSKTSIPPGVFAAQQYDGQPKHIRQCQHQGDCRNDKSR